jgi:hypothetical protein
LQDVLEMSLTPNDIRRGRTREPNFNPLENEDWRDPEGQMLAWRLNPQDGWSVPPSLPPSLRVLALAAAAAAAAAAAITAA